jgi:hypothetical protein
MTTPEAAVAAGARFGRRRTDLPVEPWAFDADDRVGRAPLADPWMGIVRDALNRGRLDDPAWSETVAWHVVGGGPLSGVHRGTAAVAAYRRRLTELSEGTYRQRLVALQGSGGPVVTAHLRSVGRRGERRLDVPSLLVVEVVRQRIERLTELPGDQAAWDAFWAD